MKKFILVLTITGVNFLSAADKDDSNKRKKPSETTQEQASFESLPAEIKIVIIQQLVAAHFDFDASIENIRNLAQANKELLSLVTNEKTVESILDLLSKQLKISRAGIAFALNTPWSLAWIKKQNNILQEEILREIFLNTTNINLLSSDQLLQLAQQLNTTPLKFCLVLINENLPARFPPPSFSHVLQNPRSNLYKAYRTLCLLLVTLQNKITIYDMAELGIHVLINVETMLLNALQQPIDETFKQKIQTAVQKIGNFLA